MAVASMSPIDQFRKQLDDYKVMPAYEGGREYIRSSQLMKWMGSGTITEDGRAYTNAERLLWSVYGKRQSFPPISHSKICDNGSDRCVVVFSILLEINLGHMIDQVQKQDIVDQYIPMSLGSLKEKFQTIDKARGIEYAERFDKAQWKFRPLTLRWDMDKDVPEQRIIPIVRKQEIGRGGQARVYSIVVQEDYVNQQLRDNLPKDEHTRFDDEHFGWCYQFALKTFEEGNNSRNLAYFNDEKSAFDALKYNKGMIKYLGSFGHKELRKAQKQNGEDTEKIVILKHILLEYGRFDLMKIFMYRLPPVMPDEMQDFWTRLIEIADGLKGIHKIKTRNGEYAGWHNDIKPGNIIVVDNEYKLADPGFAKFQKRLESDRDSIPEIIQDGLTQSYAAPECFARNRNARAKVPQSVDIWSVGCVLSMAVTWIVLGSQGVYQFKMLRQKAVDRILEFAPKDPQQRTIDPGDFFHNGIEILPEVKQWHKYLRSVARNTDHITKNMLDFIEQFLLIPTGGNTERIPAEGLYTGLQEVLRKSRAEDTMLHMDDLFDMLRDIDQEAPSTPFEVQAQQQTNLNAMSQRPRVKPKIDNLEVPDFLKTASRYESLTKIAGARSPKITPTVPALAHPTEVYSTRPPKGPQAVNGDSYFPALTASAQGPSTHTGNVLPGPYFPPPPAMPQTPRRATTFNTHRKQNETSPEPQNVLQAREEFRDSAWYRKPTDDVLKAYFDNRDIVFLVDNASSMAPYWDEATFLLETLVMKAKPFDKDGMDLFFTLSSTSIKGSKDESKFRSKMQATRPRDGSNMITDMVRPIETVFSTYFKELEKSKRKGTKPKEELTLIILTDGIWAGMETSDEVYKYILKLLKDLEKRKILGYKKRPVSIEFVQFSDNADATERLRALDDDIEYNGFVDIIDHERFTVSGDVRKMLLGSFVPLMDRLDNNINPESPPLRSDTVSTTASASNGTNRHSMPPNMYGSYNAIAQHLQPIAELDTSSQNRTQTNSTGSSGSSFTTSLPQPKTNKFSFMR
ncbi:hypothetical protein DPSP01_014098 [Paraphaeosphaeria sporulosa]